MELLDLSGVENFEDVVRDHVKTSAAGCYGVTATTPQMPAAVKISEAIRMARPAARIILGGPHVTLVHAASVREATQGSSGARPRRSDISSGGSMCSWPETASGRCSRP